MDLEIHRDDLARARVVDRPVPELDDGAVLLRVDTFGLSTNNITFGITGDLLGYWKLFPASEDGWGRIPVFGYADVVASRHPGVAEGARVFGYLPMSQHLVVEPAKVDARGFLDGSAHRRDVMATVWNHYQHVPAEGVSPLDEARRSLLRPLFVTGFLIDDFIADHDGFGADTVVISSATAKTAIVVAHATSRRGERRVVGLTSAPRADFARSLGIYDEVLTYEEAEVVTGTSAVFVDIAGRVDARDAIHARFGDALAHSMTVGLSNVPDPARILEPPPPVGPSPEVFYAQIQVAKRASEWGQAVFDARLDEAWDRFTAFSDGWLTIRTGTGPTEVERAWLDLLAGNVDPASGYGLTMWADT